MKKIFIFVSVLVLVCSSHGLAHGIQFAEVTDTAGLSYSGASWGASWGDCNKDGWPDLYTTNHSTPPSLYLNRGDTTFQDIASQDIPPVAGQDTHGAAWADFDNDGDQDLLELVGGARGTGSGPNHFFVNNGGVFCDKALWLGLRFSRGRGRTPLWFDWNGDGRLDVMFCNAERKYFPSSLFKQTNWGFSKVNNVVGLDIPKSSLFAQLLGYLNNRTLLLVHGNPHPQRVYDIEAVPFMDVTEDLGLYPTSNVTDVAIADFDGDLALDLFFARGRAGPDMVQVDPETVHAVLLAHNNEPGISFKTIGAVLFDFHPRFWASSLWQPSDIFIGSQGRHPATIPFTLTGNDPKTWGIVQHIPGVDTGIFIGYNPDENVWQVWESHPSGYELYVLIKSEGTISDLNAFGFAFPPGFLPNRFLVSRDGGFEDMTTQAGLDSPSSCGSVTAADFDNDMDVDLYMVCTRPITNMVNILYENQGDGTFIPVPDAGGAPGSSIGVGDSVTTVDYDLDGFVDLFVTNGQGPPGLPHGPYQLYRNLGSDNNWLEIDLEGVRSNRDGIGTRLFATAGGVTQIRQQVGGMHAKSQNHQRVHFGLAGNERIDSLIIEWPSGTSHEISNIPANQIIRVVEPSYPSVIGKPEYSPGKASGVYLWKETFDGPYHLRVSGDGWLSVFKVDILAEQPFTGVVPIGLEIDDNLFWSDNYLSLTSRVNLWQDGIDFALPPGTEALIAVELDGNPNPRQLHIGSSGQPITPTGWVLDVEELPPIPKFQPGEDLGLFVGTGSLPDKILARWNGDGHAHTATLKVISSNAFQDVQPINFEACCDSLFIDVWSVRVSSAIRTEWDGLDIRVPADSAIGFSYHQDGLFQSHRVNGNTLDLGPPNAYALPLPDEFMTPLPDIKANGSDGLISITSMDTLSVTISLDPGIYTGFQADWWVVANTPFGGWYHYNLNDWKPGFSATYQGPLDELPSLEVLNSSGLSLGSYDIYFGVDLNMNGIWDGTQYIDGVKVNITP